MKVFAVQQINLVCGVKCSAFECFALCWSTEEHEESVYNMFISEVRNFRMRVEAHEEQLIRRIRTPLDRDDLQECILQITEQEVCEPKYTLSG